MAKFKNFLVSKYIPLNNIIRDKMATQQFLNNHQEEIISSLSEEQIVDFTGDVYNETAEEYNKDSHTQDIPKSLPGFVEQIPENGLVLDLGCGHGIGSLYMLEKGKRVVPYDISHNFIEITAEKILDYEWNSPGMVVGDFTIPKSYAWFVFEKDKEKESIYYEIFEKNNPKELFDGIWACTSLLIHTPLSRLEKAVDFWGKTLKKGGLFEVSYFNPNREGFTSGYSIRASSTGEIKIFISPNAEQVQNAFNKAGLFIQRSSINDYVDKSKDIDKKSFFINETYQKF